MTSTAIGAALLVRNPSLACPAAESAYWETNAIDIIIAASTLYQ